MDNFSATHKTVVIVAFLGALVLLAWLGRDTTALIAVGTVILAGLGFSLSQNQTIKEQTNGTHTKMLEMLNGHAAMLAKMQLPKEDSDAAPK